MKSVTVKLWGLWCCGSQTGSDNDKYSCHVLLLLDVTTRLMVSIQGHDIPSTAVYRNTVCSGDSRYRCWSFRNSQSFYKQTACMGSCMGCYHHFRYRCWASKLWNTNNSAVIFNWRFCVMVIGRLRIQFKRKKNNLSINGSSIFLVNQKCELATCLATNLEIATQSVQKVASKTPYYNTSLIVSQYFCGENQYLEAFGTKANGDSTTSYGVTSLHVGITPCRWITLTQLTWNHINIEYTKSETFMMPVNNPAMKH